ncbi:hypothetical protein TSUD_331200 [Trifolium subterraneum]|uniref:Reverse transcriptase zinc-binding domain-containing protein n=1 Tax=Trifolium subterraneum TaxID=3900 RepID=A0A2Z6MD31_TRISU|nr:hypothetical protein TSUD_331200 [Trifolium subterraneum]
MRVLAARYGAEGGRLRDGGRKGSVWWREIAHIREGGERFGRLFELAETKLCTVDEMCSLGCGEDGEAVAAGPRYRLSTKANLVTRGIIPPTTHFCVTGCGAIESAHHLFISCSIFGSLWPLVCSWIDITLEDFIHDHFVQFMSSASGSRKRRSFLQLIWLACVWVVWTERNHRLFRGSACSAHHQLDKIKLISFRWLKATSVTLASNYHSWWSSPLLCLGLV